MKKRSLEETVELEKVRFDKRIKKLEEKRRKEEQRKALREEKKILNLDKELETMKSDIEDLRVSRDTINDTVGNNANEINTLKAKVKNYDENAFRAVTGWLSYNQKLSNQYNNYQNQMYYVCERSYLLGKVQDGCPK